MSRSTPLKPFEVSERGAGCQGDMSLSERLSLRSWDTHGSSGFVCWKFSFSFLNV